MNTTKNDAGPVPPCVTDAPATIWLQYGDIERDVTWCADKQFDSDVMYVRADDYERVLLALAGLHKVLTKRHRGRMPDEVQRAYDASAVALGAQRSS